MKNIYMKYCELRDAKGVTDYKVGKSTGISSGTFDAWKKGIYSISLSKVQKLADYFNVKVDYFLT